MALKNKIHVYLGLTNPEDIEEVMKPISRAITEFEKEHGQAKITFEIQASQEPDDDFFDEG